MRRNIFIAIVILVGTIFSFWYLSVSGSLDRKDNPMSPLTLEEYQVLKEWPKDGTEEQERQHTNLVKSIAQEAEYLDITNCSPNPLVFQVRYGESFIIKNSDTIEHRLRHSYWKEDPIVVPANNERKVVTADLIVEGSGIYGYGCDSSGEAQGILFITAGP